MLRTKGYVLITLLAHNTGRTIHFYSERTQKKFCATAAAIGAMHKREITIYEDSQTRKRGVRAALEYLGRNTWYVITEVS